MPKIFVTRRPPESAIALLHDAIGAEHVAVGRLTPCGVLLAGMKGAE